MKETTKIDIIAWSSFAVGGAISLIVVHKLGKHLKKD